MGKFIRKLIGFIFIVLIVGVVVSAVVPPFGNKNDTKEHYDNVLGETIGANPLKYGKKITDIAVLGAHDAFSEGINWNSDLNVNEDGLVNNKIARVLAKGFMVKMSRAQNATAEQLLYAGVRYFDVRVTLIEGQFYTCHGLISNKLETYVADVVSFLENHPKEYVIFDIQHYYTENGENGDLPDADWDKLFAKLNTLGLLDFVNHNPALTPIADLTYGDVTNSGTKGGAVILAKTHNQAKAYFRDGDANKDTDTQYETIRSYWHNTNNPTKLAEGITNEVTFIKENHYDEGILRVNQAQLTGFITNVEIYRSVLGWSLVFMAKYANSKLVANEDNFMAMLSAMPIFMVDNATSTYGNFNLLANKFIKQYNESI